MSAELVSPHFRWRILLRNAPLADEVNQLLRIWLDYLGG